MGLNLGLTLTRQALNHLSHSTSPHERLLICSFILWVTLCLCHIVASGKVFDIEFLMIRAAQMQLILLFPTTFLLVTGKIELTTQSHIVVSVFFIGPPAIKVLKFSPMTIYFLESSCSSPFPLLHLSLSHYCLSPALFNCFQHSILLLSFPLKSH
jgi:hypothetical protein